MLRLHNITGAMSEGLVATYLASLGYELYLPSSPHSRADLVYRRDGRLAGVQVKTATWHWGSNSPHRYEQCRVSDRRTRTAYTPAEIDELWVVGTHLWNFPVESIQGKQMLTLNSTNSDPRKSKRDYDPERFVEVWGSIEQPFRDRWVRDDTSPLRMTTVTEYAPGSLRNLNRKLKHDHP